MSGVFHNQQDWVWSCSEFFPILHERIGKNSPEMVARYLGRTYAVDGLTDMSAYTAVHPQGVIMPIRAAATADLDDLAPLFAAYLAFYDVDKNIAEVRAFLAARLERGDSALFIAHDQRGGALGFVQLYPLFASLALRPSLLLSDLYVAECARRQGVGEQLLEAARQHALDVGACGLQLETAKTNLAAQSLYERLGYVRDAVYLTYWLDLT